MLLSRNTFFIAAAGLLFLTTGAIAEIKEGRDYETLVSPQPTEAKGKIEVTEFFWYGCSHCYNFEPSLAKWAKSLPKDVAFRRLPADFGRWTPGVKLYYALEGIGEVEHLHKQLFDAIHVEHLDFNNESAVGEWLTKNGVDRKKFSDSYNSFALQAKVSRAQQLTQAHGLKGVPSIVIGGKYLTSTSMSANNDGLLGIVDELIAKVRSANTKKK